MKKLEVMKSIFNKKYCEKNETMKNFKYFEAQVHLSKINFYSTRLNT